MSDLATKLRNLSDHLQWLLEHRITDESARQKAKLELVNARALLAEWERRQWDEKREHDHDLEMESLRAEEEDERI